MLPPVQTNTLMTAAMVAMVAVVGAKKKMPKKT